MKGGSSSPDLPPRGHVFDIQRFCVHDGPGIRTTVFLSGCPLRCAWCHNPESFSPTSGRLLTAEEVMGEVLADRDYYEVSGGGLTLSGGEPLGQPRFARALLDLAKREGLHTCVQTAAAVPARALVDVLDVVDLFQIDLKHMGSERHRALTGVGTERIHRNAELLLARGARVELRMPLVPGINDDAPNLERVAAFVGAHGCELHLVLYQRTYLHKYEELGMAARCADVEPPSPDAVREVAERFRERGLAVTVDA